ncbi:MAG: MmgE/PrpD family protein [Rhodococcus fascians]|uniref:MmgE/PrpD family protein n=1 Tax=Nocardiaceae TaxID=85025 RepID=UPI000522FDD5|nr:MULTISPECIES: MmgE/PrpD family protein [Rhodococcus]OZC49186.1 MmgE/PrpD family protein [Rhodococcus sp. 06-621-2]OZD12371.1 MmgE/PrpD family protein [Rhodococcus sp. 06-156-3C]OZD13830.1 MmgE/PrpD family protein [Rhodococcus sp. 06-156-4C]OZD20997.1 MmgE/PrpD family protein [Rhodococcus sp. 06-156-4a]OZD33728.1 MmgE/PrpD family protein [Rhodococcus sp. 06-156-3]
MRTASETLAGWVVSFGSDDVPDAVAHAVKRHLLDGIGDAIAARRLGAGAPGWAVAHALGGPGEARALSGDVALSAPAAAMATGILVHALDFDDTHAGGLVHATAVVLPAALAVGQEVGATGAEVVTASVIGMETVCRLGAVSPHGFHARGLHATAVAGPLAAAVVASKLVGSREDTVVDALGIAGSSSGGLLEFLDTAADTKSLHPGSASVDGILAARLAAAGATGPRTVLDGRRGVYAALADRPVDFAVLTEDLGTRWEAAQIGIKPYPACQLMHVTLDAVTAATAGTVVDPSDIVSVQVHVHPDSSPFVCGEHAGTAAPRSTYDAKFDLPWSVAALLVDGSVTIATYTDESISRSDVLQIAKAVEVIDAPTDGPAAAAPGKAVITLRDGSTLTGEVGGSRGTPSSPLTDDELRAKFLANCGEHSRAAELADIVANLELEPDLTRVLDLAAEISRTTDS